MYSHSRDFQSNIADGQFFRRKIMKRYVLMACRYGERNEISCDFVMDNKTKAIEEIGKQYATMCCNVTDNQNNEFNPNVKTLYKTANMTVKTVCTAFCFSETIGMDLALLEIDVINLDIKEVYILMKSLVGNIQFEDADYNKEKMLTDLHEQYAQLTKDSAASNLSYEVIENNKTGDAEKIVELKYLYDKDTDTCLAMIGVQIS